MDIAVAILLNEHFQEGYKGLHAIPKGLHRVTKGYKLFEKGYMHIQAISKGLQRVTKDIAVSNSEDTLSKPTQQMLTTASLQHPPADNTIPNTSLDT